MNNFVKTLSLVIGNYDGQDVYNDAATTLQRLFYADNDKIKGVDDAPTLDIHTQVEHRRCHRS